MKEDIIHTAINKLQEDIGVDVQFNKNKTLDGELIIEVENKQLKFVVLAKREFRQHQVIKLEEYQAQYNNIIVIAENIFPNIKEKLRNRGIAYLETNGNIYLKRDGLFYYIDTNKKLIPKKEKANRAFTKTGLKVIFHFLIDADLVNQPQRKIAEITGVALGNIPQVINGLKETGFLIPLNKKEYMWENRKELLNRWINEYATVLKPKLIKGNYELPTNWQELKFDINKTNWGGEPGADILTNHLRPEKYIIFTKENQIDLIRNYRLKPKEEGNVEVYEMFWGVDNLIKEVQPLIVYADLLLEGGKRNLETAELIFDEYLQPNL